MIFTGPEINIGEDGFDEDHDWLNRKDSAERLSGLVEQFRQPLVVALDENWGSGKSHFLKLWIGEHKRWLEEKQSPTETKVIYFDAFEHDYLDDPLASLVIHLEKHLEGDEISKLKTIAIRLLVPFAKSIASKATSGLSDEVIGAMHEPLWEAEKKRVEAINEFRVALENSAKQHRLVFIIDELDRCRPDYALSLLEVSKHFFQVQNVHFILGANLIAQQQESTFDICAAMPQKYRL